jgi:hypothetical protein
MHPSEEDPPEDVIELWSSTKKAFLVLYVGLPGLPPD